MDGVWFALAIVGLLAVLGLMLLGVWLVASGEPLPDEGTTMDVQNHIGDSRPVR